VSVWSARVELSTLSMLSSVHVRRSRRPCHSPSKHQTSVVPALSQGPEPEQSHGLQRRGKTGGHPYFNFLFLGACQSHCQDNNISVNCADEDFLVSSAWAACNIMRLSASSWLQGARAEVCRSGGFLKPSSLPVMTSSLSAN